MPGRPETGTMHSPKADPGPPQAAPEAGGAAVPAGAGTVPPEQSREDTDAAWGEYPERTDDRLYRERPPHWDDF
jgi:hypothetical protein